MIVPPFVPQPIEIQNNVAEEPYLVRLGYIKRVAALHLVSVALVALCAAAYPGQLGVWASVVASVSLLVGITVIRGSVKGRPMEQRISGVMLPPLLIALGMLARDLLLMGWPVWAMALPPALGYVYCQLCGRDLSFVGMFLAGWLGSWVAIPLVLLWLKLPASELGAAFSLSFVFAFYYVYDLAALLSRRRLGEELGAVADLYRDSLNFVGYTVRVWLHWKKHKIWSVR